MDIDLWIETYGRAWREKEDEAVGALFTEGALYVSHPLEPPHRGSDQLRAYWRRATGTQEDLVLRFGEPVLDGRRAAVVARRLPRLHRRRETERDRRTVRRVRQETRPVSPRAPHDAG